MAIDDAYLESKVLTASPYQLHLLVLDGAIRFARQADSAFEAGDHDAASQALTRSRDFVTELLGGLDEGQAPELVHSLQSLFTFVYRKLAQAEIERSAQPARDAIRILNLHRETWLALEKQLRSELAAVPEVARGPEPGEEYQSRSWSA